MPAEGNDVLQNGVSVVTEAAAKSAHIGKQSVALVADGAAYVTQKSQAAFGSMVQGSMSRMCLNKEKAKAMLLDLGAPMRQTMMDNIKDVLKSSITEDPDMWAALKSVVGQVVDSVWEQVQVEVERTIEASMLKQQIDANVDGPTGDGLMGLWCRIRAFVLHRFLPHNKSIFGKIQDPMWLAMMLLALLPVPGLRILVFSVVLAMLVFPGPPDEHQLLNYVVLFKGVQFLSSGFAMLGVASVAYLFCYTTRKDDVAGCVDELVHSTPLWLTAGDYLGNVFYPWSALLLLPWSSTSAAREFLARKRKMESIAEEPESDEAEPPQKPTGGRLSRMLKYDMACFVLSLLMLGAFGSMSFGMHFDAPEFKAVLFWSKIFYSICMFPFLVIKIPALFAVITHSDPTGFNVNGACVAWAIPPVRKKSKSLGKRWKDFKTQVKHVTRKKRVEGDVAPEDIEGQTGDFTKGLYYAVIEGALDEGAEEVPITMASEPHLLLNTWDRF